MPVSPSGRRTRCGPSAPATVLKTVSLSGSGTLPTRWTSIRRTVVACRCPLEFVSQRQLHQTRVSGLSGRSDANLAEVGVVERADRVRQVGDVQKVEDLGAQLEPPCPDGNPPRHREIQLDALRAEQCVHAEVAEGAKRGQGKRVWIQPLIGGL